MAFAPESTLLNVGDGSWRGSFRHAETDAYFEFTAVGDDDFPPSPEYDMKVWVRDGGFRFARVLKTRAFVVVDECEQCGPVVEKWLTKQNFRAEVS